MRGHNQLISEAFGFKIQGYKKGSNHNKTILRTLTSTMLISEYSSHLVKRIRNTFSIKKLRDFPLRSKKRTGGISQPGRREVKPETIYFLMGRLLRKESEEG